MRTRELLDLITDEERLSGLLDGPTRATRVRIKAGVSICASVICDWQGGEPRWLRFLWPKAHSKARRARVSAARLGISLDEGELGDLLWQAGPVESDPALAPHVGQLLTVLHKGQAGTGGGVEVLRHNPLRRLVLGQGRRILRLSAAPQNQVLALHHLIEQELGSAAGSPIPAILHPPVPVAGQEVHLSVQERVGEADLADQGDSQVEEALGAHRRAGALLARLHRIEAEPIRAHHLQEYGSEASEVLGTHARILADLAPDLAARAEGLRQRIRAVGGPQVLLHGDASPDQFLTDRDSTRVWLTDFDRAGLGAAAVDLGSYLETSSPQASAAFLDGYTADGTTVPGPEDLHAARLLARSKRLAEPLRSARPTWEMEISAGLDELEGRLA